MNFIQIWQSCYQKCFLHYGDIWIQYNNIIIRILYPVKNMLLGRGGGLIFSSLSDCFSIYCSQDCLTTDLTGLLMLTSRGCKTDVQPPGLTTMVVLCRLNISLTFCVRWAEKLSRNSKAGLLFVYTTHTSFIHFNISFSSTHAFSWYDTTVPFLARTPWTHRRVFPLYITIGGSILPEEVQDKIAVTRHFSDFVVGTLMDFFPFLSIVLDGTVSKNTGVSSILAIISYRKSPFYRTKKHLA